MLPWDEESLTVGPATGIARGADVPLPVLAVEPALSGAPLIVPLPDPLVASDDPFVVPWKPEEYGGWQTIVVTTGRNVGGRAFAPSVPSPPVPAPPVTEPASTAPLIGVATPAGAISVVIETHVQGVGQSESTLQVVALGWQYPGNDVVVVQVVVGSTATGPPSLVAGFVATGGGALEPPAPADVPVLPPL